MKLDSITEMAAKKFCPNCGKTMAGNHYWYKGGWRCKGGGKPADATQGADVPRRAGDDGYDRHVVPPGFEQKIASLKFGDPLTLTDGTNVRFISAETGAPMDVSLISVRIADGPAAGRFLLVKPEDIEL